MRAWEFLAEAEDDSAVSTDQFSDVTMVLGTIYSEVKAGKIKPEIPFDTLIARIQNEIPTFDIDDLISANDQVPAIQKMVKNIDSQRGVVVMNTGKPDAEVTNQQASAATNPEQTVSSMAQSALKRRQD